MPWTSGVGTVVQLAGDMQRAFERVDSAMAMIADIHPVPTNRTVALENVKFQECEIRFCGPALGHCCSIHAV